MLYVNLVRSHTLESLQTAYGKWGKGWDRRLCEIWSDLEGEPGKTELEAVLDSLGLHYAPTWQNSNGTYYAQITRAHRKKAVENGWATERVAQVIG